MNFKGKLKKACTDRSTTFPSPFAFPGTGKNNQHRKIYWQTEPVLPSFSYSSHLPRGIDPLEVSLLHKAPAWVIVPWRVLTRDSNENRDNIALLPLPAAPGSEKHRNVCYSSPLQLSSGQDTFPLQLTCGSLQKQKHFIAHLEKPLLEYGHLFTS